MCRRCRSCAHRARAALLESYDNGDYLIRKKGKGGEDDFVLSLKYKDVGTHHMLSKEGENVTLNKKEFGGHTTIGSVNPVHACMP